MCENKKLATKSAPKQSAKSATKSVSQCFHGKDEKENTILKSDKCGLLNLEYQEIYYILQGIHFKSTAKYGANPVPVSQMLWREMRVYVLLFKEVGYLLSKDSNASENAM
eukprot:10218778-Ditylum_brightwellii.AAC.1